MRICVSNNAQKLSSYTTDWKVDWSEKTKMFENTYLYRIHQRKRYSDTISCYLTTFNFIYTTGQHFDEYDHDVWWFLVGSNYMAICLQNSFQVNI